MFLKLIYRYKLNWESTSNIEMSSFHIGILDHNYGQLILAGDPKQLGPVLRSPIGLKFGLQTSLLERLMLLTDDSSETEGLIYKRSKTMTNKIYIID